VTRVTRTTCEARRLFIGLSDDNLVGYDLRRVHDREARWLPANCRDARIFADWKSRTTRDTISLALRSIVWTTRTTCKYAASPAFGFLPRQLAISSSRESDNRSRFRTLRSLSRSNHGSFREIFQRESLRERIRNAKRNSENFICISLLYIAVHMCIQCDAIMRLACYQCIRPDRNLRRYPLVTVTLVPATGFN